MKCAYCLWTSILLESCVLRCFFRSFPNIPILAAPCRIHVTFVLLPETCRAAQLEYLVSLSAWMWRFLRDPDRHIRSSAKAPLLRVLLRCMRFRLTRLPEWSCESAHGWLYPLPPTWSHRKRGSRYRRKRKGDGCLLGSFPSLQE
jgi:hypothetical protein